MLHFESGAQERFVPATKAPNPDAPGGGHNSQSGAVAEAAPEDLVDEEAPAEPDAAPRVEAADPPVAVAPPVVAVEEVAVGLVGVGVVVGNLTAPYGVARLLPATPEVVAAVCAAAGAASCTESSTAATRNAQLMNAQFMMV
jgi:hypothetical protein